VVPKAGFPFSTAIKTLIPRGFSGAQAALAPQTPRKLDCGNKFSELRFRTV
jgi:hypothetical protein